MEYYNEKLEEFNKFAENKKVAIIGMGVSNIPLLDYFYETKSIVTVFDDRNIENIDELVLDKIKKYGFKYFFGKDNLDNLKGFDIIFRSPSCMPFKKELEEAVKLSKEKSKPGDIVLLSPASASFDAFKNFAERGEKFKEFVKNI